MQTIDAEYETSRISAMNPIPPFRAGHYLRLTLDDGRSRPEVAKVLVIGRANKGPMSSFVCLRAYGDQVWRETYPLYCPEIQKIEVLGAMPGRSHKVKMNFLWEGVRDGTMTATKLGLDAKSDAKQANALRAEERAERMRAAGGAGGGSEV